MSADIFSVPLPGLPLLAAVHLGEQLSPEQQVTWDAYQDAVQAAEQRRDMLGLVDIEALIEEGITPPEMLIPDRIVARVHQSWYGPKEVSKTWVALIDAASVLRQGGTVIWIDKEMGRALFFERVLLTLQVPKEDLIERFIYAEYPSLDCSRESITLWKSLIEARRPTLLVADAQTELLADANLNENLGTDIARWANAYLTPVLRLGGTTLMLDHTGYDEQGRARGSGHKGNFAKAELAFQKLRPFDREDVGEIELTRTKNTLAAPIPEVQRYRIGGSPFIFERVSDIEVLLDDSRNGAYQATHSRVYAYIKKHAGDIEVDPKAVGLTMSGLREAVTGTNVHVSRAATEMSEEEPCPVYSKPGPTGKPKFYWSKSKAELLPGHVQQEGDKSDGGGSG